MELLKSLKFVQGAVAKRDLRPELKYFNIVDGMVTGTNGQMELRSPIQINFNVCPDADQFVKAVSQCDDTVTMYMTEGGRLAIKCGNFKSFVECIAPDTFPIFSYEKYNWFQLPILQAIKTVAPFMGEDASRVWSNGILFRNNCCYATNNIVCVQYDLQYNVPTINMPQHMVNELLRINEEPSYIGLGERSIQVVYEDGRILTSVLLQEADKWPNVDRLFEQNVNLQPVDKNIFTVVNKILPFTDKIHTVYFEHATHTVSTEPQEDIGTHFKCDSINFNGCYNGRLFASLKDIAVWADFNVTPAQFYGDRVRGVIVGMKR